MHDEKFNEFFASNEIRWQFNLTRAPWWGGQFERLVGLVKRALNKTIGRGFLTWDELREVILDVKVAINRRLCRQRPTDAGFNTKCVTIHTIQPIAWTESISSGRWSIEEKTKIPKEIQASPLVTLDERVYAWVTRSTQYEEKIRILQPDERRCGYHTGRWERSKPVEAGHHCGVDRGSWWYCESEQERLKESLGECDPTSVPPGVVMWSGSWKTTSSWIQHRHSSLQTQERCRSRCGSTFESHSWRRTINNNIWTIMWNL